MKLNCPDILSILRHKPIMLMGDGVATTLRASDKRRQKLLGPLLPMIHQAQKYIFDSGSDQDPVTIKAVRDTAVAMMEADLFHQPHPVIWIENPYDTDPETDRNYYLGIETPGKITIHYFAHADYRNMLPPEEYAGQLPLTVCPHPLVIDLTDPSDQFTVLGLLRASATADFAKIMGEVAYAYKKMIVTLNSVNHEVERVTAPRAHNRFYSGRFYDHHVIRIPMDHGLSRDLGGTGIARRKHLVRGYVYGKNTRPREEQRWVKPYWRGNAELGQVTITHSEIVR